MYTELDVLHTPMKGDVNCSSGGMNYKNVQRSFTQMTQKFTPYSRYKTSGIEWIKEIPAHWDVKRLKNIASLRVSKFGIKPDDSIYVGLEHIESWTGRLLLQDQPVNVESVVGQFRAGDVLFGKLRPYLAKVARPNFDGVSTSEILAFQPRPSCCQSYMMYCLLNEAYIGWIDTLTYGAKMPRVSPEQICTSFVPLPPLAEQRAIAAFLDRETVKLDALIEKKKRLIALIQEKRTALVSQAVTQGLNPSVCMKSSGIEWLGKIPVHWEVRRLKNMVLLRGTKLSIKSDDSVYVGLEHIESWTGRLLLQNQPATVESTVGQFKTGDVLFGKLRPYLAKVARPDFDGVSTSEILAFQPRPSCCQSYMMYCLLNKSYIDWVNTLTYGAKMPRVSSEQVDTSSMPFPPLAEQRAIVAFLDRETTKLDALISKISNTIEQLQELRIALVSAAVTGQIDIRFEAQ